MQRKAGEISGDLKALMESAQRLYEQRRDSKNKLYALHAPEVGCIVKGNARTRYEFGVKTSVAVTAKEGVVVGVRSMPGAPYDGHTLHSQLEQVEILTGVKPTMALAEKGYRGEPPPLKNLPRRRHAIVPTIGHIKATCCWRAAGSRAKRATRSARRCAAPGITCGRSWDT